MVAMKPSERITKLAAEFLADVERRATPANFEVHRHEYANAALARAIVQYLDQKHAHEVAVANLASTFANVHIGDGDELGHAARALSKLLGTDESQEAIG